MIPPAIYPVLVSVAGAVCKYITAEYPSARRPRRPRAVAIGAARATAADLFEFERAKSARHIAFIASHVELSPFAVFENIATNNEYRASAALR
jgi:hypothetical protein